MAALELHRACVVGARRISLNTQLLEPGRPGFWSFEGFREEPSMNPIRYSQQRRTKSRHSYLLDSYVSEEGFPFVAIGTPGLLVQHFEERSDRIFDSRK